MAELRRFDTPEGRTGLENARKMAAAGLDGFLNVKVTSKAETKAMPNGTQIEKDRRRIQQSIKEATDRNSIYHRAAQPYLDAQKLLIQQQNYTHLDEILVRYDANRAEAEPV